MQSGPIVLECAHLLRSLSPAPHNDGRVVSILSIEICLAKTSLQSRPKRMGSHHMVGDRLAGPKRVHVLGCGETEGEVR